ncbi:MAG: DUF1549 domain-containing protein, partial [Burkholderiales bacterium]|nr:DUF1549 domain-containing protein [Burkholderiales bacterium]
VLREWIEQRSPYEQHWSYRPITASQPPPTADQKWPRNEIDRFILARLQREGLQPAAEAGREQLIRRLSFDLTGLPPTL